MPKKTGRPSEYDKKYCNSLIAHMSKGFSFQSFAAIADVHLDTLYEWAKVHPEFSEAKNVAFQKNLLFWEQEGIKGLWGSEKERFNSTVWIFNMKNRHRWRDRYDDKPSNEPTPSDPREKEIEAMTTEQQLELAGAIDDE